MKKVIVTLIILAVAAGLAWLAFLSPVAEEQDIKQAIIKANYCEVATDCQMVAQSQCPFGCNIHVNKHEVARISTLLENYESNCAYSCTEFKGVECINKTCQIVQ